MKTHHLWVLGILLLGIGLLAFLGFFKSQEGFADTPTFITMNAAKIATFPKEFQLDKLRIRGTMIAKSTSSSVEEETPIETSVPLLPPSGTFDGIYILASKASDGTLRMTSVQVSKGAPKEAMVQLIAAKAISSYTGNMDGTTINAKWMSANISTPVPIYVPNTPNASGFGLKDLRILSMDITNPTSELIRCPTGYTFFNGPNGDSMCCRGTVNPYTHTCNAKGTDDLCAFSDVKDPRQPTRQLPLCGTLASQQSQAGALESCPSSLPHYAAEGENVAKCCMNPVEIASGGYKCSTEDLKDTSKYCVAKGTPVINQTDKKMEKLCDETILLDNITCPTGSSGERIFQTVEYVLGERESKVYNNKSLAGKSIPVCFGVDQVCIPEMSIQLAQKMGAFTDKNTTTWKYSCNVWKKKNQGMDVSGIETKYP